MSVPGYYGCDCDRYNPNCRCYPRETTMSEQTKPPTKTQTLRALRSAAEHIEQASNALLRSGQATQEDRHALLDIARRLAIRYGQIERGEQE